MEKVIPVNYGTIKHLPGSKMINDEDKNLNPRETAWLTEKTKLPSDIVTVTEKVDGCNVGVLRNHDELIPVTRKGYDVRTSTYDWIREFANFVDSNKSRFLRLLNDGERVCGEWMIKTHTLSYKLPHEPFIAFDLITGTKRETYLNARDRLNNCEFIIAGLIHYGTAIPVECALKMLGSGFHGVIGEPEGIVYRYETQKDGWQFNGKYVSNPLVGNDVLFKNNIESGRMNNWKQNIIDSGVAKW